MRTKRRRRKPKSQNPSCLPLLVLLLALVGVPALLVRSCTVSFFSPREIPLVQLWDTKKGELISLTLEEYVQGVVAAEMPPSFHLEALKAQAVAARTYAYRRIVRGDRIPEHPEAHLSSDYRSGQAWMDWTEFLQVHGSAAGRVLQAKIKKAVKQTEGIIAVYDDEPILAVYHSTSGGRTENSEHYWNEALPYLRAVEDPFSSGSPVHYSTATITLDKLAEVLGVDSARNFKVLERYPSGRVKTVEAGDKWFSGREIRERLSLRSTWFTAEIMGSEMVFSVWGYGHGVGMSQYGAQGMALQGYTYEQILQYYYQGIELKEAY
ncbi:MAG: stage II sporulation protein D [Firmicutes bacterium]|nr:stage II sporulation protein D [Bacillota bacterium]